MDRTSRNPRQEKNRLRFDFAKAEQVTVKDLLEEINADSNRVPGAEVTFRSLSRALDFVQEVTGVIVKSKTELVDIQTLKVLKLLFTMSDKRVDEKGKRKNIRNIFSLLQRPEEPEKSQRGNSNFVKKRGRATMESCTGTTIPRDPLGEALIGELVTALSIDIDPEKLATMEAVLSAPGLFGSEQAEALSGTSAAIDRALQDGTKPKSIHETRSDAEKLLDHLALGSGAVEDLLFRQFGGDDNLLASAYRMITSQISKYGIRRLGRTEVPVHEALYIHARTLGLQHFILHHRAYIADIHVDKIHCIEDEVWLFCEEASKTYEVSFGPRDYVVSLARFDEFANIHVSQMMALVELATGWVTPAKAPEKDVQRAQKVIKFAVYRRYDRCPPEEVRICILDIIAALCSVRYQQEIKTEYSPYWESQQSQGSSPERMLDVFEFDADPEFGLHQGVLMLYHNRYKDYLAAFTGTSESHKAFREFELCRFDGYLAATQSRSLMEFQAATLGLSNFSLLLALDIVYANLGLRAR